MLKVNLVKGEMMKKLVVLFLLVASTSLMAEPMKLDPAEHSCAEMQAILVRDGAVYLKGLLGFYDAYFATRYQCPPLHNTNISYVTSQDQTFCQMGFTCRLKP